MDSSATVTSAASSAVTASFPPPSNHRILEITLISAQDLAPISKAQRTYALIWVNPNKKRSTGIDPKGHTNPTWNHKFSFRVDDEFLRSDDSAVTVEIYAVAWFRDVLVGSVRINVNHILAPHAPEMKNERFMGLQIRRPSGDPQGMLNMGVSLFDSAARGTPICSDVSASSSDCRDLLEKKMNNLLKDGGEITEDFPANPGSVCNGDVSASSSDCRDLLEKKMNNFLKDGGEITEDFPANPGSVCNGSALCGGSEVCSDIGPSASLVAAEIARKSNPPAAQGSAGPQSRKSEGESLILEELTAEEAAAKGMTTNQAAAAVKKKGRLFSCFGNAYGFEASEESPTSSSLTGSSLSSFETRSGPNTTVPEPQPVNQMPGQVSQERDEPVDDEPSPYDPDSESYERWVNRLDVAGYFALPSSYPLDIYPRVSKIAQNKARRNLPEGYVLEYDPSWPNIIEPHRDDRVGFHIISLESGTVFPLRPLLVELCHCFKILPGQLTPNAHRFLNAFVNICSHLKIDPSLRFFLYLFEVLPGKSGCDGYVYFKGRNGRQFISDLPQSNRLWKEKFVFIKFPTTSPLAGLKWSDHILKPQYTEPASTPALEESLEKLLRGDPFTGQMFHYGAWIWRIQPGGEGTSMAHEAAGHGVPALGNTAEAGGPSHPEMNFRAFNIPTKKTVGSSSTPRTVPVQQEPVEIHSEEETPPTGRTGQAGKTTVNPPLDKGKGKVRTKHAATTHPSAKRRRGENVPASESLEELWVKMGQKLKKMGEVGPESLEKLTEDSSSRSLQLEEKLKGVEAHNRELQDLIARQLDEMANLSAIAGGPRQRLSS
ncbi:unnamed protein product [Cuscuta campestris]|uniref:C2 domain-containing protein n=1 Tax=Cuscuta campestris TaxID=132261 RepID=A0A484KRQ5_9ASTE|nr:unnamed protein product [Cuscuta campestris]